MPPRGWIQVSDALKQWTRKTGLCTERLALLHAIWEKEMGHFSNIWRLIGVRRGVLYVSSKSPSAAVELRLRGGGIIRSLNKHFKSPWIKGIKPTIATP